MEPNKPTAKHRSVPRRKDDLNCLGVKKRSLKPGNKDVKGAELKPKLDAIKKLLTKPSELRPLEDGTSEVGRGRGVNRYAQEVVKDTIGKKINEKFELVNPKAKQKSTKQTLGLVSDLKKVDGVELSEHQTEVLLKKFNQRANINIGERIALANELGLTEEQVKKWFSSRRTKLKKSQELSELSSGQDVKQAGPVNNRPTMKKTKGVISSSKLTQAKDEAASNVPEKNVKDQEVIDVIDDEEDLENKEVVVTPSLKPKPSMDLTLERKDVRDIQIGSVKERVDPTTKACKTLENDKDKEIEILRQEIKVILNDMVKKSVMDREVDVWKTKFESLTKAFREKEQFVKDLEVKIPNMIGEYKKCVENKEYLVERKEKELKELEATVTDKDAELEVLKSQCAKLTRELDKLRMERNDYASRAADFEGTSSVVKNDVTKKLKEIELLKEKRKEDAKKIDELKCLLEKSDSLNKKMDINEFNKLKARSDSQANTLQNLTKTCEYQKTQLCYLKNEVEAKVDALKQKEVELKHAIDKISFNEANLNQLIIKSDSQYQIIENQKNLISQFQIQSYEKTKDIEELQSKIKKINAKLVRKVDDKQGQINNLKRSIGNKNTELERLRIAQDKLFSQLNDLELRNYNMVEKLKVAERKYESAAASEKYNLKTVNIHDAAKEYIKILKSAQKINKREQSCKMQDEVSTVSTSASLLSKHVDYPSKNLFVKSVEVDDVGSNVRLKLNVSDEATPEGDMNGGSEITLDEVAKESIHLEAQIKEVSYSNRENTDVYKNHNYQTSELDFHDEGAKKTEWEEKDDRADNEEIPIVANMKVNEEEVATNDNVIINDNCKTGFIVYTEYEKGLKQQDDLEENPNTSVESRKLTRKLLKRPDVVMGIEVRNRSTLKRSCTAFSGIPFKRRRLSSEFPAIVPFDAPINFSLMNKNLLPGSWERLVKMKHVMKMSRSGMEKVSNAPDPLVVSREETKWPIVPYTRIKQRETKLHIVYPAELITPFMTTAKKRFAGVLVKDLAPKRRKLIDDSTVWPIVPYRFPAHRDSNEAVVTRKIPEVHSLHLMYSKTELRDVLPSWILKKRPRGSQDQEELIQPLKKVRLCAPQPSWPVALYFPSPSARMTGISQVVHPSPILPLLCTNYPVIEHKICRQDISNLTISLDKKPMDTQDQITQLNRRKNVHAPTRTWPVALYNPPPAARMMHIITVSHPGPSLPPLCSNYPVIKYKIFNLESRNLKISLNKRPRGDLDQDQSTRPFKMLRLEPPEPSCPVAVYFPQATRMLLGSQLSFLRPYLPTLCTNFPLIAYRKCCRFSVIQGPPSDVPLLSRQVFLKAPTFPMPFGSRQDEGEVECEETEFCQGGIGIMGIGIERDIKVDRCYKICKEILDSLLKFATSCDNHDICQDIVDDIFESVVYQEKLNINYHAGDGSL